MLLYLSKFIVPLLLVVTPVTFLSFSDFVELMKSEKEPRRITDIVKFKVALNETLNASLDEKSMDDVEKKVTEFFESNKANYHPYTYTVKRRHRDFFEDLIIGVVYNGVALESYMITKYRFPLEEDVK